MRVFGVRHLTYTALEKAAVSALQEGGHEPGEAGVNRGTSSVGGGRPVRQQHLCVVER